MITEALLHNTDEFYIGAASIVKLSTRSTTVWVVSYVSVADSGTLVLSLSPPPTIFIQTRKNLTRDSHSHAPPHTNIERPLLPHDRVGHLLSYILLIWNKALREREHTV